jgi:hypothetical protein
MPIGQIIRMWSSDDYTASADVDGKNRQRSHRFSYSIDCTAPETDTAWSIALEAATSYGFVRGAVHPHDAFLRLVSVRVGRESPLMFRLDTTSLSRGFEPGESPLDEPPDIESDHATTTEAFDRDVDGKPIMTVNGEGFDPPITDEISDLVLTISKNVPTWDYLQAWLYMGGGQRPAASNSDEFLGFPAGSARVRALRARSVTTDDFSYFKATGTFQFRNAAPDSTVAKAWWKRVRSEGFLVRNPFDLAAPPVRATDGEGAPAVKPVQIDPADGTEEADKTKAHWVEFQLGLSLPFSVFGLG